MTVRDAIERIKQADKILEICEYKLEFLDPQEDAKVEISAKELSTLLEHYKLMIVNMKVGD